MTSVTFAVFGYNQEDYIAQAIEGAFAQVYKLLEIILIDDASIDRTPGIMTELADRYKGSVSVRVVINDINLGYAGSVSKVMEMAKGDLVILAAGDDIALPHRAEVLVDAWEKSGRQKTCLYSRVNAIDDSGDDLGYMCGSYDHNVLSNPANFLLKGGCMLGSAVACPKSLFEYFGPLSVAGIGNTEDVVLSFRSALMGGPIYVEQPLLLYRIGTGISTLRTEKLDREAKIDHELLRLDQSVACTQMMENDLEQWSGNKERLRRILSKRKMVQDCIKLSYKERLRAVVLALRILTGWLFNEKINLKPVAGAVLRALSVRQ
jgi:glycosyltransferase involved in cell wall biosynthesis